MGKNVFSTVQLKTKIGFPNILSGKTKLLSVPVTLQSVLITRKIYVSYSPRVPRYLVVSSTSGPFDSPTSDSYVIFFSIIYFSFQTGHLPHWRRTGPCPESCLCGLGPLTSDPWTWYVYWPQVHKKMYFVLTSLPSSLVFPWDKDDRKKLKSEDKSDRGEDGVHWGKW